MHVHLKRDAPNDVGPHGLYGNVPEKRERNKDLLVRNVFMTLPGIYVTKLRRALRKIISPRTMHGARGMFWEAPREIPKRD